MYELSYTDINSDQIALGKKSKKQRKLFSPQEDAMLSNIMFTQTFQTWFAVAEKMPGRTARQCRDRWVNYLSPSNKNGPWTPEEDQLLNEKYMEFGPQWTSISKFFDGRSENNVKNRWYTYMKPKIDSKDSFIKKPTQSQNIKKPTPVKPSSSKIPKVAMTPSPYQVLYQPIVLPPQQPAHFQVAPQPVQLQINKPQKIQLPPISVFDQTFVQPPVQPLAFHIDTTPRYRSESVQPFVMYENIL